MLTVLVGNDTKSRVKKLETILSGFKKNKTEIHAYNDVNFNEEEIRMSALSTSLFGGTSTVVISGVSDNEFLCDQLEKIIPILSDSPHQFIISDYSFYAPFLKKVEKYKGAIEEFEKKSVGKKVEAFNTFALTDAFSERRRSTTWALYRKAIDAGLESRELCGKIFWIVKNMLVAQNTLSATECVMNSFVYQKAKAGSKNFTDIELQKMATTLTFLFHEALHGINLETSLESFVLESLQK